MVTTNSNISFGYYNIRRQIANPRNEEEERLISLIDELTDSLKDAFESKEDFSSSAYDLFALVFQLRIDFINWVIKNPNSVDNFHNEFIKDLKNKSANIDSKEYNKKKIVSYNNEKSPSKYVISEPLKNALIVNSEFAIRSLKRVYNNLFGDEMELYDLSEKDLPKVSYNDFMKLLRVVSPTQKDELNFISTSLMVEICLIGIDVLFDNYKFIKITEDRVKEINSLMVNNARLYGASAMKLGLIGGKRRKLNLKGYNQNEIEEGVQLAELGMQDYKKALENE